MEIHFKVKHGLIVTRKCNHCMKTIDYFEIITHSDIRHSFHTAIIRGKVQKLITTKSCWRTSERYIKFVYIRILFIITQYDSFAAYNSFLKRSSLNKRCSSTDIYSLLSFETLQIIFLSFSKLISYCMVQYIYSRNIFTKYTVRGSKTRLC